MMIHQMNLYARNVVRADEDREEENDENEAHQVACCYRASSITMLKSMAYLHFIVTALQGTFEYFGHSHRRSNRIHPMIGMMMTTGPRTSP